MTIDKSGEWWKGTETADLHTYVQSYAGEIGYPVGQIVDAECACGGHVFKMEGDETQGCAGSSAMRVPAQGAPTQRRGPGQTMMRIRRLGVGWARAIMGGRCLPPSARRRHSRDVRPDFPTGTER